MTKWLEIARGELGVTEKAGKATNARVTEYFEASGHREIKDDETAWCSAFANFCMEKAGHKGTMSLAARSWLRWGKKVEPKPGAVMVFKRGNSSWQGHVTFFLRETATHYICLGGNQGNAVRESKYGKKDFLEARWPSTMGGSRTVKTMATGGAATTASVALETVQEAQVLTDSISQYVSWAAYAAVALTIICFGLGAWFRFSDMKEKGL